MNLQQIKNYILQIAGRIATYSFVVRNDAGEGLVYVDGAVSDLSEGESTSQATVRKLQWYGFRSRPPVGSEALIVAIRGSSFHKILAACDSLNDGPLDLADGEAAVFSQSGSTVKLDQVGNITVIPSDGAKVRLGSNQAAELDAVVLYEQLKAQFDAFVAKFNGHTHSLTGTANLMTGAVTGTAAQTTNSAAALSSDVSSSNVQAKK